jgi:replicative DNA helicase
MNNRLGSKMDTGPFSYERPTAIFQKLLGNGGALPVPEALDAEKGLLSSILMAPTRVMDICIEKQIGDRHFRHPAHVLIFATCREMLEANKTPDQVTLTRRLEDLGALAQVGGSAYVTELFLFVPTASNAKYYAEIICEKFTRRRILELAAELALLAHDPEDDIETLVGRCEEMLLKLRGEVMHNGEEALKQCKEAAMEAADNIEAAYHKRGGTMGVPSGIPDWDRRTGGFRNGDMIVIGARPSQGKSALGMQIAEYNAIECKRPTAVFSVEMTSADLMERTLLSRAEVDLQKLRDGMFSKRDLDVISHQVMVVGDAPLYIDKTRELTIAQLRARARMARLRHKVELIVVDYLQLMRSTSKRAQENRQIEIAEICAGIKGIAMELGIPIVVLAQLSRDVEKLARLPRLADLKESGAIEQDADQVLLIHQLSKKELKEQEEKLKQQLQDDSDDKPAAKPYNAVLLLCKQRKGPKSDTMERGIHTNWIPELTKFRPLTEKLYSNNAKEREHA